MQPQTNYSQLVQSINKLGYSDKKRLFNHLKSIIDSTSKTGKKSKNISWLGCLKDYTDIHGDIISPVMDENQWEVLSE
jgi:hypothetical protein